MDNTEQRRDNNEDNPEHELKDLNGLRPSKSFSLIKTSIYLL
jgi:hypothetical protein